MNEDNNIPIVYCSKFLRRILKEKGCNLIIEGTNKTKSAYDLSEALNWLYINFGYSVWASYDDNLKYWCGNYSKEGETSSWLCGFATENEAIEEAAQIVLDYLI